MLAHSTPVSWILSLRCDELTTLMKVMPFVVSDTFFTMFIAIGFWRRRHPAFFLDLILLVSFTSLLNNGLKGFFGIPRPDVSFHLIPLMDPWGFPSGDVQQTTIFWGALWLYFKRPIWGIFALTLIPLVMFSRAYLGVHSGYDILGGLAFGLATLFIYQWVTTREFLTTYFTKKPAHFWLTMGCTIVLYCLMCPKDVIPLMVPLSIGALLGYGLTLPKATPLLEPKNIPLSRKEVFLIMASLGMVLAVVKLLPSTSTYPIGIKYPLLTLKLALIVWIMGVFMPRFQERMRLYFKTI